MPVDKKRKTKTPEDVPGLGDPDRKRVLNVLAQRRYRQKRKEKIAQLEAKTRSTTLDQALEDGGVRLGSMDVSPQAENQDGNGNEEALIDVEEILRNPSNDMYPLIDLDANIDFAQDIDFSTLLSAPNTNPLDADFFSSSSSSTSSSSTNSFPLSPDATTLPMPVFATLHAFGTIATALNVASHIFDPNYLHILTPPPSVYTLLPPNLYPTPAQLQIPHHPILDIMPWPSVREKLICMFAMPSAWRPAIAREDEESGGSGSGQSKAIVQIITDMDETGAECRVHGNMTAWGAGNEMAEEAWEIGEKFFENWWWCLDGRIVEVANRRRRERGLRGLRLKS